MPQLGKLSLNTLFMDVAGEPTTVEIDIEVRSMSRISEMDMVSTEINIGSISLSLYSVPSYRDR